MSVIEVEYTKFKVQFLALSLSLPALNSVNTLYILISSPDRTDNGHYITVQALGAWMYILKKE